MSILKDIAKGDFHRTIGSLLSGQTLTQDTVQMLNSVTADSTAETQWPYVRFKTALMKTTTGGPFIWAVVLRRSGDADPDITSETAMETYRKEGRLFHWELDYLQPGYWKMIDVRFRKVKPAASDQLRLLIAPGFTGSDYAYRSTKDYSVVTL